MTHPPSIYDYITGEEANFSADEIQVYDNYSWNLQNYVQMSLQLKHGVFTTGANNYLRPFKKVIEPILNLRYRAEDIELKDVVLYVENDNGRVLSFLIKKYHDEVYVKEHDLDSFFDEAGEENINLGGVLVQKGQVPEVMPLQFLAFCDQTDILGGPLGFKYYFSPDKLREKVKAGWGNINNGATITIDELIVLAELVKDVAGDAGNRTNRTPGKNIEVYIVRGSLPEHYLEDNDNMENYYNQLHIVAFYTDKENNRTGVTLYRKKEQSGTLKFFTSQKMRGRALGQGGAESLFHEQIWTNFLEIHKTNLLESASKVPLYTDDDAYSNRNRIIDMENLEITTIAEGKFIRQVPTAAPVNIQLFERSISEWFSHAQILGSAGDPLLGVQPPSGTPFRLQERVVREGKGIHEYRRGKFAKFVEEIYRDWIIPDIRNKILKGKKFLATLDSEEMQWVSERLAENQAIRIQAEQILSGEDAQFESKETLVQKFKGEFIKKGNKQFLEILRDEFRDVEIKLSINIAGKQKDLADLTDKVTNIFKFIFANPQGFQQVMQIPGMSKAFSDILEFSGLNPVDFSSMPRLPVASAERSAKETANV
ncbi:MAG: hypothetical protein UT82_C0028G0008 [Parcubacteria group bacterium GW2011_GWB1_40_14]|nr:MAG: hypothetical protein UT82_C0028G0008 [Parcubacteria group bacterium GW2011_GWB1_40_14]